MTEGTSRRFWQICLATLCFFSFLYRWQFAGAWWFHLTLEWTSRNVKEDRAMKGWMNHQHCSSPTLRSYKKKTRKRPTQIPPPTPAAAEEKKPLDRERCHVEGQPTDTEAAGFQPLFNALETTPNYKKIIWTESISKHKWRGCDFMKTYAKFEHCLKNKNRIL